MASRQCKPRRRNMILMDEWIGYAILATLGYAIAYGLRKVGRAMDPWRPPTPNPSASLPLPPD